MKKHKNLYFRLLKEKIKNKKSINSGISWGLISYQYGGKKYKKQLTPKSSSAVLAL
jgi:hypothetical protein